MSPYLVSLLSQLMKQWSKPSICQQQATKLSGPISPACDRYVQYLLAEANRSVLNRHRWGLQLWRCWLDTSQSPTLPTSYLHFPSKGPARSEVIQELTNIPKSEFKKPMAAMWSSDHSAIYRGLLLHLAIANNLSLAKGFTRIDQKDNLIQLRHQSNSYNQMHKQEPQL
jgi:hypothetical protein